MQVQQQLEAQLGAREASLGKLQQAVDLRERAIESLAAQLKGYQGVGPEAVAALQREHAALSADKVGWRRWRGAVEPAQNANAVLQLRICSSG